MYLTFKQCRGLLCTKFSLTFQAANNKKMIDIFQTWLQQLL